jgi:voltage-gated potassium channel
MRRGLWYSLALCLVIMLFGGAGFWMLEPRVITYMDGLWLAFTTAATVGYGDMVPQTQAGRVFAALMVLLGLSVLSLVTASLAAIFVEQEVEEEVQAEERVIERELRQDIRSLHEQLRAIEERLDRVLPAPHDCDQQRPN